MTGKLPTDVASRYRGRSRRAVMSGDLEARGLINYFLGLNFVAKYALHDYAYILTRHRCTISNCEASFAAELSNEISARATKTYIGPQIKALSISHIAIRGNYRAARICM